MPHAPFEPQDDMTLVPNQVSLDLRLAEWFRARPNDTQAFRAPAIALFSGWAQDLARRAALLGGEAAPLVPGRFVIQRLWEQEVARDGRHWLPAECRAVAAQAFDADRLLQQWTEADQEWGGGVAWRRFERWRRRVHRRLELSGLQTHEQQLARLTARLDAGSVPAGLLPRRIVLDGFAELTRLESSLVKTLNRRGVEAAFTGLPKTSAADPRLCRCETLGEELLMAARWARDRALAGAAPVAVIVNGLGANRDKVRRAFEDVFESTALLAFSSLHDAGYRLREGMSLAKHPLVAAAFNLLELSLQGAGRNREFGLISRWLLSPAWSGADTERYARAALEHRLRERGGFQWSPRRVYAQAGGLEVPELAARVARWPDRAGTGQPADQFRLILRHWGWPGPMPLDWRARRAVQQFLSGLEELERFEGVSSQEALATLRQMCLAVCLPAGGGALSPVQIIDPEEAWGCRFAAAWAVNLNADTWPGPVRQNPFLPPAVNRLIPRARPDGLLDYTRALHHAVLSCAPIVTCSWSSTREGVPSSRSRLLGSGRARIGRLTAPATLAGVTYPDLTRPVGFHDHPWLEAREVAGGIPLPSGEQRLQRAVSVLELQFSCPFAAFLVHRLQAVFLAQPSALADAAYAGLLLHKALERLYEPHLDGPGPPSFHEIAGAVDASLDECRAGQRLPPVVLTAERQRLRSLLGEWLEHESGRRTGTPHRLEHLLEGELAGFRFDLRIDRIDRMPDGRWFVLDYKSGALPAVVWDTERLTQPQAPLYAVLLSRHGATRAGGAALASLRSGEIKLKGLSDDPDLAGGGIEVCEPAGRLARRLESWDAALREWERALQNALVEYRQGECAHQVYFHDPLRYLGLDLLFQHHRLQAWAEANGRQGRGAGTV